MVKATQPAPREARIGTPSYGRRDYGTRTSRTGEEALGERASPLSQEPLPSPKVETLNKDRDQIEQINNTNVGNVERWGI